jgi:3-dehydroquinate dehydratase
MCESGPDKRQFCNLVAIHSAAHQKNSKDGFDVQHLQGKKEIQVVHTVHEKSDQALGVYLNVPTVISSPPFSMPTT